MNKIKYYILNNHQQIEELKNIDHLESKQLVVVDKNNLLEKINIKSLPSYECNFITYDKNGTIKINKDFLLESNIEFIDGFINLNVAWIKKENIQQYELNLYTPKKYFPVPLYRGHEKNKIKALFLDRDGVLIKDTHYPHKESDFKINIPIIEVLKKKCHQGFKLFIVTNQSGIARGYFNIEQYEKFTSLIVNEFKKHEIVFDAIDYCPFHIDGELKEYSKNSYLRKPWPGMILNICQKFNIDLDNSLMVGDKDSDSIILPGLKSLIIKDNNFNEI